MPLSCISLKAQNLVPNGSFEEYYQIPTNQGQINYAKHWFTATASTPDYFSRFSDVNSGLNVPNAIPGFQDAFSGDAYSGIFVYDKFSADNLEYIETKLTSPLISQKCYTLSFYVSMAEEISCYTLNNIGVFFSQDSIYVNQFIRLSQYSPQVINDTTNQLTDTLGWTKITQDFFAEGGEKYMVIGNFNNFSNDNTTKIRNLTCWTCCKGYMYIDSVSLRRCGETFLEEDKIERIRIYPNPANEILNIDTGKLSETEIEIFDISGRLILQQNLTSNQAQINISSYSNGLYFVCLSNNKGEVIVKKVSISH